MIGGRTIGRIIRTISQYNLDWDLNQNVATVIESISKCKRKGFSFVCLFFVFCLFVCLFFETAMINLQ